MFKLSGSAHQFLTENVEREKQTSDEDLFVRLSMGVG